MRTCVLRRLKCVFKFRSNIFPSISSSIKKKLYGTFLWMGFNFLKATEPLRGDSLLFATKFPEIPGTHLIDLGRMEGIKGLRVTFC